MQHSRHGHADQLHRQRQLRRQRRRRPGQLRGTTTLTNCTVSGNSARYERRRPVQLRRHDHADQLHRRGNSAPRRPAAGGVLTGNNLIGATDGSIGWIGSDLTGTSASRSTPSWRRWATTAGRPRRWPCCTGSPAIDAGSDAVTPASDHRPARLRLRRQRRRRHRRRTRRSSAIARATTDADATAPSAAESRQRDAISREPTPPAAATMTFNSPPGRRHHHAHRQPALRRHGQLQRRRLGQPTAPSAATPPATVVRLTIPRHGHASPPDPQRHRRQHLRRGLSTSSGGAATLTNCTSHGNTAANRRRPVQRSRHDHADQLHRQRQLRRTAAAALFDNSGGTTTLTNCTVSGNSAARTAAASTTLGTTTLTNCTVSGNSAANDGGRAVQPQWQHRHAGQHDRGREHGARRP